MLRIKIFEQTFSHTKKQPHTCHSRLKVVKVGTVCALNEETTTKKCNTNNDKNETNEKKWAKTKTNNAKKRELNCKIRHTKIALESSVNMSSISFCVHIRLALDSWQIKSNAISWHSLSLSLCWELKSFSLTSANELFVRSFSWSLARSVHSRSHSTKRNIKIKLFKSYRFIWKLLVKSSGHMTTA